MIKISRVDLERSLIKWVVCEHLPFTSVNSPHFLSILRRLHPSIDIFSSKSLAIKIKEMFPRMRENLKEYMGKIKNLVSFTTDVWTSPNQLKFLCITAHFFDNEFQLKNIIIEFINIPNGKGETLANYFWDCVKYFELEEKVFLITLLIMR